MKQNAQPKAAKTQRQSQLPLQHAKRSAKKVRAQYHLYVCRGLTDSAVVNFLEFSSIDEPVSDALFVPIVVKVCDACRSQQQQKVLNISDAALIKECKDILSRSAAGTGAQQQPSHKEQLKRDASVSQRQVVLDIMDAETQLLEVSPHARLKGRFKYEAAHQPGPAHCAADQMQNQKDTGFALPAAEGASDVLADMHDSQPQPEPRGKPPKSSSELFPSVTVESAANSQLNGAAAEADSTSQPSASALSTAIQPESSANARPASNQGGNSIDALLQAMLTGELA